MSRGDEPHHGVVRAVVDLADLARGPMARPADVLERIARERCALALPVGSFEVVVGLGPLDLREPAAACVAPR